MQEFQHIGLRSGRVTKNSPSRRGKYPPRRHYDCEKKRAALKERLAVSSTEMSKLRLDMEKLVFQVTVLEEVVINIESFLGVDLSPRSRNLGEEQTKLCGDQGDCLEEGED